MLELRICLAFCPIPALFVCAPSPSSVFLSLFCPSCLLLFLCSFFYFVVHLFTVVFFVF